MTVFARGPLPVSVSTGPPNAGLVLINPDALVSGGNYSFLNLMKHALGTNIWTTWILADNSGILAAADQDSNGYPTVLRAVGGVTTNVPFPDVTERPTLTYVARWANNGTISVSGATLTGGSFTGSGGSGRAAFTLPSGGLTSVSITAFGGGGYPTGAVTNLAIFHADDEADYLAGKITGVETRARVAQAKTPVWRVLNWGYANLNNNVTWAHRKPTGYVSYTADEWRSALFAGTTTGSGFDYSITFGSGSPTDKQVIHLFLGGVATGQIASATISGTTLTVNSMTSGTIFAGQTLSGAGINNSPLILPYGTSGTTGTGGAGTYAITVAQTISSAEAMVTSGNPANSPSDQSTGSIINGVVTWTAHGFTGNEPIVFTNNFGGISLPSPFDQFTTYYVVASTITTNGFKVSTTTGGSAITSTGTATGTAATRTYTLNLNSTGAVPVRPANGQGFWSGYGNPLALTGALNAYTAVYEASINCWLLWGGTINGGLANGVPIETFIQYCAELGCNPWLIPPFLGTDPMSDWTKNCAQLFNPASGTYIAPSWMVPRFETCNEPWNTVQPNGNFPLYRSNFNWNNGEDLGNFLGKIGSTIGQDLASVLGASNGTKYHLIVNQQTGPPINTDIFNSTAYHAQGSFQSGYNGNIAKTYLTHVAVNHYHQSIGNATTAKTQWNAAVGSVAKQAVVDGFLALGDLFLTPAASFTGSISGNTLTVSSNTGIAIGQTVSDWPSTGVAQNTKITAGPSGLTWTVSGSAQSVSSRAMISGVNNGLTGVSSDTNDSILGLGSTYSQYFTTLTGLTNGTGLAIKLCGYEGGFAQTGDGDFVHACKAGTNVRTYYTTLYRNFINAGGVFPAEFKLSGPLPSGSPPVSADQWSILEGIYQSPDPPQWLSITLDLSS